MIRPLAILAGATAAVWVLLTIPVRLVLAGAGNVEAAENTLPYAGIAAVLCLVPAAVTLAWATWAVRQSPDQQFAMVMGGTGIRLAAVLVGAFALHQAIPYLRGPGGYWSWVAVFYLVTLGLETVLVTRRLAAGPGQATEGGREGAVPPSRAGNDEAPHGRT